MLRIILINCLIAFIITANAQNCQPSKKHTGCYIPPYRPRGDKHENCKNNSGRQGVWNFYSYNGFLLSQLGYIDDKVVWSIMYYVSTDLKGETKRKISGIPPDSILNPKKKLP